MMLLLGANALVLGLSALRTSVWRRHWWVAGLGLLLLLHLLIDGFYQSLVPVYVLTVVLIAVGFRRHKTKGTTLKARVVHVAWGGIWRLAAVVLLAASVVATWNFGNSRFFPLLFAENSVDFSELGWSDAFDRMNEQLAGDYAFGDWKALDWEALHDRFSPYFIAGERAQDLDAYYLALREYVYSLPDGHFGLYGEDLGLRKSAVGGSFGLNVMQMDDGRVIATQLSEGGPAERAGLLWGAEILTWNAIPVVSALEQVSIVWFDYPVATREGQGIQKQHLLTRAPIDTSVTLTFQNPQNESVQQASLTAVDDEMVSFYQSQEMGLVMKVEKFIEKGVPGVVIDVRRNLGGYDSMAPMMMAYFCTEPMFYEQVAYPDDVSNGLSRVTDLVLEPATPVYTGPVAMLIDNFTVSTGEGFPMIMQRLNRGPVIGFYGTYGSFGMSGSSIKLPGDYVVAYANGASLDENGEIQLDSDRFLQGGVLPDKRVPITEETLKAIYLENRDILLETAIESLQSK